LTVVLFQHMSKLMLILAVFGTDNLFS